MKTLIFGVMGAGLIVGCVIAAILAFDKLPDGLVTANIKEWKYHYSSSENCTRPYQVTATTGSAQGKYFCRQVDKEQGSNCLEQGWHYDGENINQHDHDWKLIYWGAATVEVTNAPTCFRGE